MGGATEGGHRRMRAAARSTEGTSRISGPGDGWAETKALERGRVQITFLVDPRFLEVARAQEAELERSWGCVLLVSGQQLGQIVVSGLPDQAQTAARMVCEAIRYRSRREQGQVRRNGGRLDLPAHPDPQRWHRHPAVVVLGSSCAPPHAGHVATLVEAWRRAEAEGYRVEAAYLVPARHKWLEGKVRRYAWTQSWRDVHATVLPEAVRVDMCNELCKDLNENMQPHQWSTLWERGRGLGAAQVTNWMRTSAKVGSSAVATVREIERSRPNLYVWDATGTGRIGSRQQLAENAWLVSLGCSGGAQRPCRDHLHIIQHWFEGKPILLKIGRFSLYACGNGLDLPHLAKRAFCDQIGPNVQKAMLLGSPSHQGLKNCGFSPKYFFSFFDHFLVFGDFFAVFSLLAIF